ncbi:energy transducer TonB [Hymenobacter sp. DG25A]|uniref:energy transducer TonB n=1 Tax=Hymenobacter sp. DG25A TaxID=1385663 RepID=UPI000A55FE1E|nr:energy transducer TonB [Hymenobacter sp. DG25A]
MNTAQLQTASLDDMIFEGRNKVYGAYLLRRLYNRHLATAITLATALFALLIATPLVVHYLFPPVVVVPELTAPDKVIDLLHYAEPKSPPAASAQPIVRPQQDIPTKVVKTLTKAVPPVADQPVAPTPDGPSGSVSGTVATDSGAGTGSSGGIDSGSVTAPAAPPAKPFVYAEVMPEFAGGQKALQAYLQRHLRFPSQAIQNQVSGRVYVAFTVEVDGGISDVEIVKGLGYGTGEEAERVVRSMPDWTPGRQNGQNVAVRYTLPITFQLE